MTFKQIHHANGLVTLESDVLARTGVTHAFSTRCGGISQPPFHGLNLAAPTGRAPKGAVGDDPRAIAANFRLLRSALGMRRHIRMAPRQVHGADVWQPPAGPVRPGDAPEADAVISHRATHMLVVRTADCVPLLMAARDGSVAAAVHAGWRGLVAGVIPAAIERFREAFDVPASRLVVAIGPAIGVEHYEVGHEVAAALAGALVAVLPEAGLAPGNPWAVVEHRDPRPHVNLVAAARIQVFHAGVPDEAIDVCGRCTYAEPEFFFSHRRDGSVCDGAKPGGAGRMAAVIAARS